MTTGPYSVKVLPSGVTPSQPQTLPSLSVRSFFTVVFIITRARSGVVSQISSSFSMRP